MTTQQIQAKNDAFRKAVMFAPQPDGKAVMTRSIANLGSMTCAWIYKQVAEFDTFNEDNDPYGEHDFGSVTVAVSNLLTGESETHKVFWKIDYYADADMEYGTADRLNAYRVLVIMLAEEY